MTRFRYRAYAAGKSIEEGILESESRTEVMRTLARRGVQPFEIREEGQAGSPIARLRSARRLKLTRLFQDLDVLMNAGFTIDAALVAITAGSKNRREAEILETVLLKLRAGATVADAFAQLPGLPDDVIPLLESGERSGRLDKIVRAIAGNLTRQEARRASLIEAMLYPAFLLFAMLIALIVITFYLVPSLMPIFENAEADKPVILTTLAFIRNVIVENWSFIGIAVAIVIAVVYALARNPGRWAAISLNVRRIPFAGSIYHKRAMGRYLHSVGLLLGEGVAMPQALELGTKACPDRNYQTILLKMRTKVIQGAALVTGLKDTSLLDHSSLTLLALGEEVNRLPDMLQRAASLMERDMDRQLDRMLKVLTPAITIVMGLLIGGLAISVMGAILSINDLAFK